MPMFGKSRTLLRVKTSLHKNRYYRVDPGECLDVLDRDAELVSEDCEIRLEPIEKAYIARPLEGPFAAMTYQHFCECYEISRDPPSSKQRLHRWKRLDEQGYIKERTRPQAICKSPRIKADPSNAEYFFLSFFFKQSWRSLEELPTADHDCIHAFARLSTTDGIIADTLQEDITREVQWDLLSEATSCNPVQSYPAPEWTLNDDIEYEYSYTTETHTEAEAGIASTISSKHPYTTDDVARAETFITKVVKPFVKEARNLQSGGYCTHTTGHQYPVDEMPTALSDDQWIPFALCMKQSRERFSCILDGSDCAPMRMIINREGGTGKSYVIEQIVRGIHTVFADKAKRVLLMAHQGTAVFNIGGETICSALGLGTPQVRGFNKAYIPLASTKSGLQKLRRFQDEYKDVHLIIVDEYSVISCGMLYWMNERLKEIFPASDANTPYGGRDIIFVGDPAQLGPVMPAALTTPADKLVCAVQQKDRELWQEIDCVCELTSQNRCQNDPEWFDALRRLREMTILPQDLRLFNTRCLRGESWPEWTNRAIHIAYKNEDVDRANNECIKRQQEPVLKIEAKHEIICSKKNTGDVNANTASHLLMEAVEPSYTCDKEVRPILHLAVGAPVTLTVNFAQTAGLYNGTRGVIYDFMFKNGESIPIVLVQVTSKYVGPSFFDNIPNIVPIPARTISWGKRHAEMKVRRTGLPLRLGYAMTVHKVQGLTCDWLVFDPTNLPSSTFAYIGLSRVRKRQNIILTSPILFKMTGKQNEAKSLLHAENKRTTLLARVCSQNAQIVIREMKAVARMHNTSVVPR